MTLTLTLKLKIAFFTLLPLGGTIVFQKHTLIFQPLICNRFMEFNEIWQEARTLLMLQAFLFTKTFYSFIEENGSFHRNILFYYGRRKCWFSQKYLILLQEKKMVVFTEISVLQDGILATDPKFQEVKPKIKTFKEGMSMLSQWYSSRCCLATRRCMLPFKIVPLTLLKVLSKDYWVCEICGLIYP